MDQYSNKMVSGVYWLQSDQEQHLATQQLENDSAI